MGTRYHICQLPLTFSQTRAILILDPISEERFCVREVSDYQTLTTLVLCKIKEMILSLELRPGQRVSQEELSQGLGVSRMPVREALRVLESEGLVESVPHRGVVVTSISIHDVQELGMIRCSLEGMATELAAEKMDRSRVAELEGLLNKMRILGNPPGDNNAYLATHREFHLSLYDAAGSPRLSKIVTSLWEASERYRRTCALLPDRRAQAAQEHWTILGACQAKDAKRARLLMEGHLRRTTEMTSEFLARETNQTGGH